jgi:hypothetical protein
VFSMCDYFESCRKNTVKIVTSRTTDDKFLFGAVQSYVVKLICCYFDDDDARMMQG